jgi:hypothetical protein
MNALSIIEICVLETLKRRPMPMEQIQINTGLNRAIVNNILLSCQKRQIVEMKQGIYQLVNQTMEIHKNEYSLKYEIIDLLTEMTKASFSKNNCNSKLNIHKKWLSPLEMGVYNSLVFEINKLFKQIKNYPDQAKTKEMVIVVNGQTTYGDLLKI